MNQINHYTYKYGYHDFNQAMVSDNDRGKLEEAVRNFATTRAADHETFVTLSATNFHINDQFSGMSNRQSSLHTQFVNLKKYYYDGGKHQQHMTGEVATSPSTNTGISNPPLIGVCTCTTTTFVSYVSLSYSNVYKLSK